MSTEWSAEETARLISRFGHCGTDLRVTDIGSDYVIHANTIPLAHMMSLDCFDVGHTRTHLDHACHTCMRPHRVAPKGCPCRNLEPSNRPRELCFLEFLRKQVGQTWTGEVKECGEKLPHPGNVQWCYCTPHLWKNWTPEIIRFVGKQNWSQLDKPEQVIAAVRLLPWVQVNEDTKKRRTHSSQITQIWEKDLLKNFNKTKTWIERAIHATNNTLLKFFNAIPFARLTYEQVYRKMADLMTGFYQEMKPGRPGYTLDLKDFQAHLKICTGKDLNEDCPATQYEFKTHLGENLNPWIQEYKLWFESDDHAGTRADKLTQVLLAEGRTLPTLPAPAKEEKERKYWDKINEPQKTFPKERRAAMLSALSSMLQTEGWTKVTYNEVLDKYGFDEEAEFDVRITGSADFNIPRSKGGKMERARHILTCEGITVPRYDWESGERVEILRPEKGKEKYFLFHYALQSMMNAMPNFKEHHYSLKIPTIPFTGNLVGVDEPGKVRMLVAGSAEMYWAHSPFAGLVKANLARKPFHKEGLTGSEQANSFRNRMGPLGHRDLIYDAFGNKKKSVNVLFYDFTEATDNIDRMLAADMYSLELKACGIGAFMRKILVTSIRMPIKVTHPKFGDGICRNGVMMGQAYAKALLHTLQELIKILAKQSAGGICEELGEPPPLDNGNELTAQLRDRTEHVNDVPAPHLTHYK
jgi:hypothetical protein